jgi:hypothetical protein
VNLAVRFNRLLEKFDEEFLHRLVLFDVLGRSLHQAWVDTQGADSCESNLSNEIDLLESIEE